MKASWNGQIIAQSDDTVVVENNHYFPESSLQKVYIEESETTSFCPWKGRAKYYTLLVGGQRNVDAVWYYPSPKEKAKAIEGRVAFWKGVEVVD